MGVYCLFYHQMKVELLGALSIGISAAAGTSTRPDDLTSVDAVAYRHPHKYALEENNSVL